MNVKPYYLQAALACLVFSPIAQAALGGGTQSIQADLASMHATQLSSGQMFYAQPSGQAAAPYTVEVMKLPRGTEVHQYLSASGVVFAVTWRGPALPNLKQLLGSYKDSAANSVAAYRRAHPGIGSVSVSTDNLVIQSGGHMGAHVGLAYLPQAVPAGVALSDIK